MHRLDLLSIDDLITCSAVFKERGAKAACMEEAAQSIVEYLQGALVDADGRPACPLVRLYKSHRYAGLAPDLKEFAEQAHGGPVPDAARCLTLLGTSGDEADWNDRRRSRDHRAIPLVSPEVVAQSPMIAALIQQLGVDVAAVASERDELDVTLHHRHYNVFFVAEAEGSPMVPAQDGFVRRYGIRSVVGCGGMLPSGDLFALILFSRLRLSEETADLFRTLALSLKATIVPFTFEVFAGA